MMPAKVYASSMAQNAALKQHFRSLLQADSTNDCASDLYVYFAKDWDSCTRDLIAYERQDVPQLGNMPATGTISLFNGSNVSLALVCVEDYSNWI